MSRYRTTGDRKITDTELVSKNEKKLVMTVHEYGDRNTTDSNFEKDVIFFYPFVTSQGEYRAYKIDFVLHDASSDEDITQLRQLIESLELPGDSPFKS